MLLLDGGYGAELMARGIPPEMLRNGSVVLERPETVGKLHKEYLRAGADIITTCTFMAQEAATAQEINRKAVSISRRAIADYRAESGSERPILIAGSVGPTSGDHGEVTPEIYIPQMTVLIENGVDVLLIETIVDPHYCRAAIVAAKEAMTRSRRPLKVMLSASVSDSRGLLPCGIEAAEMFVEAVNLCESLGIETFSVGLNCSAGPAEMAAPLQKVAETIRGREILLSIYPNAGFPDAGGHYCLTPTQFAAEMSELARICPLDIAGGCCGTTPRHISAIHQS